MDNNIIVLGNSLPVAIVVALAGLGLFFITIKFLSTALRSISNNTFKKILLSFSNNTLYGVLFGFLFTTIIQSSDGAIALVMGLLAARMLKLKGAVAFLLGANLGTATTSIIVALSIGFKFTDYFMLIVFIGAFIYVLSKRQKATNIALLIFSIGAIFLGLKLLSAGARVIIAQPPFDDFIKNVTFNPWLAATVSIFFTGLFQSSSATVALYQNIYSDPNSHLLLANAIALIIGANIGTTFTGLIVAFVSNNKDAKRIAFLWGFTNTIIGIFILIIINPFANFINIILPTNTTSVSGGSFNLNAFQLSIAHLFFNLILVGVFIGLIKYLVKLSMFVIKPSKDEIENTQLNLPISLINSSPELAYLAAEKSLNIFNKNASKSFSLINDYIQKPKIKYVDEIRELTLIVNELKNNVKKYILKITNKDSNIQTNEQSINLLLIISTIEKIINKNIEIIDIVSHHQKKGEINIQEKIVQDIFYMNKVNIETFELIKEDYQNNSYNIEHIKSINISFRKEIDIFLRENILEDKKINENNTLKYELDFYSIAKYFEKVNDDLLKIYNYLDGTK